MKAAVFLDRDGIINKERGEYTFRVEDFKILPGVAEAISLLHQTGYLCIIISNQSGIAKGIYTHSDVQRLHQKLQDYLQLNNTVADDFYYCPHHPSFTNCLCRKPGSLLVEKAIARYRIDPERSFLIGDKERDIIAGNKTGVRSILVTPNQNLLKTVRNNISACKIR